MLVGGSQLERDWIRAALRGSEFGLFDDDADILLIDVPDGASSASVTGRVRASGVEGAVVLMTADRRRGLNEQAAADGAQGTLLKTGSAAELLGTLRAVAQGVPSFDSRHPARSAEQGDLSPRERDVLVLVAQGATNREIAAALDISPETVKTLLTRTFAKLGVHRREQAVAAAHGLGLL